MGNAKIEFASDRVKLKVGHRVDNSGEVTFEIGEYQISNILPLANIRDKILKVTVEVLPNE